MNRIHPGICATITLLLFSGCVSQHRQLVHFPVQAKSTEDPDKGRIYVMRHPWLFNLASHMALLTIWDGTQEIGTIAGHRGFLCWEREPGQVTISAVAPGFEGTNRVNILIEKGKVYYIVQGLAPDFQSIPIDGPGGGNMLASLKVLDEDAGL